MIKSLSPAFEDNNISVCFSADNNFVECLGVCLKSLIENSSPDKNYDIVILESEINEINKERILKMKQENVSIRFFNVDPYVSKFDTNLFKENLHISKAAYYRFFITDILKDYSKVLYLDCDALVIKDISDLYETDLDGKSACAVRDNAFICFYYYHHSEFYEHVLKYKNKDDYFNSGMLLLNLEELRDFDFCNKCVKLLKKIENPVFLDQDIINSVLYGKVKYLSNKWNFSYVAPEEEQKMSPEMREQYNEAKKNPYFLHFAGHIKPWSDPSVFGGEYFWKYAKMTPFYEKLIYKNTKNSLSPSERRDAKKKYKTALKDYTKYRILAFFAVGNAKNKLNQLRASSKSVYKKYKDLLER